MRTTPVVIELLSHRLDIVAVSGGRSAAGRRIPLGLPPDPAAWARSVRGAGEALRSAVEELELTGAAARLVYRSPTQAVDLSSYDLRTAAQASSAATLSAAEGLRYPAGSAVIRAAAIGRDRAGGERRRWHVLTAADRLDMVRALVELVEGAGLRFLSATPLEAAMTARLVRRALRGAGSRHAWLHFGSGGSFLALGGGGRLRFERSIGLGVETIVAGLTRPIQIPDREPVELSADTARQIVHRHGIPAGDDVVVAEHGLSRRQIMPQIQPVLQRYVVELRQSLRFGLPEAERRSIRIGISGPGAAVPGLIDLLARELEVPFDADPDAASYDDGTPGGPGSEMLHALEVEPLLERLNVQPPETAARRQVQRIRRSLWAGAAATLAVVAIEGVRLRSALDHARDEAAALEMAAAEIGALRRTHDRLVAALGDLADVERSILETLGARPDLSAVLHELSLLTPSSVRINSLVFGREQEALTARLYGRAAQTDDAGRTELEPFIEAIKHSPLFRDAELRNVEAGWLGDGAGQRFEAAVELVAAPDSAVVGAVTGAAEGPAP